MSSRGKKTRLAAIPLTCVVAAAEPARRGGCRRAARNDSTGTPRHSEPLPHQDSFQHHFVDPLYLFRRYHVCVE
jgi:hypothetical protein